jgi:DNA recombination-dependent growth factor C
MVIMHKLNDEELEEMIKSGEILSKVLDNNSKNIKFVLFESVKIKSQRINGIPGKVILQYDLITGRYK